MTFRRGLLLVPKAVPDENLMQKRGTLAYLASQSKRYCRYPFAMIGEWFDPPIMTNQFAVFYKWSDGVPVGYITWALLAPDVEQRWRTEPNASLHFSEWNEGESLWIMDFLALPGYCEDIVEYIDQNLFAGHKHAYSLRRKADGTVRKITCWKRRNGSTVPGARMA